MRKGEHGILVTPSEAAQILHIPLGTLYRWAHDDAWQKFGGARSRYWRWDDILVSCSRRRGDSSTQRQAC